MAAVVFFHAHPDDEAIFTGGTIARLAEAGRRVVAVFATRGERGASSALAGSPAQLPAQRWRESLAAAEILGVERVESLGWHDSGMAGDPGNADPAAFAAAPADEAAAVLAEVLVQEAAEALVVYDEWGIYGHPDHVQVHVVGRRAAALAGVACVYEATVDREYLHFVETHLVVEAGVPGGRGRPVRELGLAATSIGAPTVLISHTVDVRPVLARKRAAMAAHASQIPETASAMSLPTEAFAAVYGYEWYIGGGRPGPLDDLV